MATSRIASGVSGRQWVSYAPYGIMIDVDTSAAKFRATPVYVTSLHGHWTHWATTGGSSVCIPTPTGFALCEVVG
jgi:hypothetical protein